MHIHRWILSLSGICALVATLGLSPAGAVAKPTHAKSRHATSTRHRTHAHKHVKHKRATHKHTKATPAPAASSSVRDIPVSFTVVNDDSSDVPCLTDGATYRISGDLILPAGATPQGVTLYAHGLGFGEYFWNFSAVPGYDYAGYEAAHGHASVIIDRLGYGRSGKPQGDASCLGGQATILHEIIGDLRSGTYTSSGAASPAFSRVGLVGHSIGGELAEIEAYSFHDVTALGIMDITDGDFAPTTLTALGADGANCATGGDAQGPGGPGGYSPFATTAAQYDALFFNDADPRVEQAATALRSLDPCGDIESAAAAQAVSVTQDGTINVPVVFVWGSADALFPEQLPWAATQEKLYSGSPKVTNVELPDAGHAVTLERTAPLLQSQMSAWLTANRL